MSVITAKESGQGYWMQDDLSGPLRAEGENRPSRPSNVITYDSKQHHNPQPSSTAQLTTKNCAFVRGDSPMAQQAMAVRRLTPRECERLQGFKDDHTLIPWRGKSPQDCPDGPRYKALGNSMAVPCMAWIGKRIAGQHMGQARYLSVCSGIEAASVAWEPLGWEPAAFAEVEKFPSAVLAHHWPQVPNLGDMTRHESWNLGAIELLVGGTPCQSFSVAGLRKGLRDPRGGLMLTFLEIAQRQRPRWIVWENVPGVLSSHGGRDFGAFLGALGALGYGWAYRVLDAQWFGVAQRRRRVFVVGCLGDGAAAATVLFESESVQRNPAPSREARERTAATLVRGSARSGGIGYDNQAIFSQNGDNFVRPTDYPDVVGTLSDGAHNGGGLTAKMPTPGAYSPCVANPLTARMGKGINTTLDQGQTPKTLLAVAQNPHSSLHQYFTWDDSEAARKYREEQARALIRRVRVTVETPDAKEITVRALWNVKQVERDGTINAGRAGLYLPLADVMRDEKALAQIIAAAKSELRAFSIKYRQLNRVAELSGVFEAIEQVV